MSYIDATSISMRKWKEIQLAKHTPREVLATARLFAVDFLNRMGLKG